MGIKRQNIIPIVDAARDAAKTKIEGFELGTDSFNAIGAQNLRNGDPTVINQIRQNRQQARMARTVLGIPE